jgi:rhamnosyltransferase
MRMATEHSVPDRLMSGKEVCAVLVTYHPDLQLPARVDRLVEQVGALVIVDNGSDQAALAMLRELCANPLITLVSNLGNLGVARALNIGIERALGLGFAWVLLMDQDSSIDDDMARTLIEVRAAFPDASRLAVIGSGFESAASGAARARDEACGPAWEEVESVITSGSLISSATHAAIGPFREEFFIDYVDTEYCFRARAMGYRVIKTRRPIMSHAIGAPSRHNVLWTSKWTTNHSADRRYYIARNDTVMLREYGHYALGSWALKSLLRRLRTCKRILLYERMKTEKTIAVAQGWWDGVRGRLGPRSG